MATARRQDMTIAGAVVIISQVLTNYQSTTTVATEIKELREAIQSIRTEQQNTFAKKEQVKAISSSMEDVKSDLQEIKKQIKMLSNQYAQTDIYENDDAIECSYFSMPDNEVILEI